MMEGCVWVEILKFMFFFRGGVGGGWVGEEKHAVLLRNIVKHLSNHLEVHTIILSYYHTIILSYYHTIILSYYHTIILERTKKLQTTISVYCQ